MCRVTPTPIEELHPETNEATVLVDGESRRISLAFLEGPIAVGDYITFHMGYAIARLDPEDARETLELIAQCLPPVAIPQTSCVGTI